MSLVDKLRGFSVLQGFTLKQLSALAGAGEERLAEKGETVFRENDDARELVFLIEGRLELRSHGNHLAEVPSPGLVGEMGVLRKRPRVATATAKVPCRYLALAAEEFRRLVDEDPALGRRFYENLSAVLMGQLERHNLLAEFIGNINQ